MKLLEKRRHSANLECTAVAHLQAQQPQQQFCQGFIVEKLVISQQMIDLRRQNHFTTTQSLLLVAKGKNLIDQIRHQINQISQSDHQLLEEQSLLAARSAEQIIFYIECGLFLTFFILAVIYYYFLLEITQKRQIQKRLQHQRDFSSA